MKQRILVAVVGVPALLLVLCWAPHWATLLLLIGLCVIGSHELLHAVCDKEKVSRLWGFTCAMAVFTVYSAYWNVTVPEFSMQETAVEIMPWLLCASVVALFCVAVATYGTERALSFQDVCAALLGGIAIPLAFSCLLRLRLMAYGGGLVLMPLVAAFMSDTMALFTGMACGKHKLAPKASPKKTVEGAIGGLIGGVVGMVLYRIVFYFVTVEPLSIGWCMVIGLVGAFMGQLGDLSFSVIKRQCGIKDYGRLLPGHGGVLDRFDSVIFAAPVVWMIASAVFHL